MDDRLCKRFGTTVRALRKRAGVSIERLAGLANLDVSYVGQIETGKRDPSLTTVAKIAKGLGVGIEVLFADLPMAPLDVDQQLVNQAKSISRGRTASQRRDILAIMKQLHDPERAKALRRVIRA